LKWPSSIAVDSDGFIFVTEKINNRVSIFDKQQNFFFSFDSQGPHGIAIFHSAGTVYVTNHDIA